MTIGTSTEVTPDYSNIGVNLPSGVANSAASEVQFRRTQSWYHLRHNNNDLRKYWWLLG